LYSFSQRTVPFDAEGDQLGLLLQAPGDLTDLETFSEPGKVKIQDPQQAQDDGKIRKQNLGKEAMVHAR
jgi:hypothetical protein